MWALVVIFMVGQAEPLNIDWYHSREACLKAGEMAFGNITAPTVSTPVMVYTCIPDRNAADHITRGD